MNQITELESKLLKIVTDEGLSSADQSRVFNRLVKRIGTHGDASVVKTAGRKALSASHKKRTYTAWCKKRLEEKHAKQAEDGIQRKKAGRPLKNKDENN